MLKALVKRTPGYLDLAITASARNTVRVQANGTPATLKNLMTAQKLHGKIMKKGSIPSGIVCISFRDMREREGEEESERDGERINHKKDTGEGSSSVAIYIHEKTT